MTLYFENCYGEMRELAQVNTMEEANKQFIYLISFILILSLTLFGFVFSMTALGNSSQSKLITVIGILAIIMLFGIIFVAEFIEINDSYKTLLITLGFIMFLIPVFFSSASDIFKYVLPIS